MYWKPRRETRILWGKINQRSVCGFDKRNWKKEEKVYDNKSLKTDKIQTAISSDEKIMVIQKKGKNTG